MSNYVVKSVDEENKRLEQGTQVIRAYMNGNVFLAPIDTQRSHLKILDSAASNGYWLSQFQASLKDPGSATLIGTDIQDRFPDPPRPGVSLHIHDINKPWPEPWGSTFDFVHQTLVLFQAGPNQREALASLARLVKPGGWIELMEPQYGNGENATAAVQFGDMVRELWGMSGTKPDFAADLEGLLTDAGFVDVASVLLPVGVGPKHKDPALADVSVDSVVAGGKNIVVAEKLIPGGLKSISKEDFGTWIDRFEEELRTKGAIFPMRVVYGRKPQA
ncbi:S-adenosyl-L-methionine-dependent methyltransferase [Jackrogersella minutella]|nr:S-adenosyl-L-methionine-dependent methyltransferase [Jackrogersella minutella]